MRVTELMRETVLGLPQASQRLPGHPAAGTIRRWTLGGYDGVILESFRLGRKVFTSEEALHRFVERTAARADQSMAAAALA